MVALRTPGILFTRTSRARCTTVGRSCCRRRSLHERELTSAMWRRRRPRRAAGGGPAIGSEAM